MQSGQPSVDAALDVGRGQSGQAKGFGKTARIEAGLVGAGRTVDPSGLRMARSEIFRQLRSEHREGRHAQQDGDVARSRVVADEGVGLGEVSDQQVEIAFCSIEQPDLEAAIAQTQGDVVESLAGPLPHRASRPGVHDDPAHGTGCPRHGRVGRPAEYVREGVPMVRAMGMDGAGDGLREQQPGSGPGITEPPPRACDRQQRVIARVRTGRYAQIEGAIAQRSSEDPQLPPRPAMKAVFAGEPGPRGVERQQSHVRSEASQESVGVGFGDERDLGMAGGAAEKRNREGEVAEAPEFGDEERRTRLWGWFCQAGTVKISL